MKISPINGLVFSSAAVGGMNSAHFDNFLAQARTSLDIKEEVIFAYDGVPAHWNLVIPAPDTEPKMFPFPPPPHSPFLNIVELSESGNQGRNLAQRRMDNRDKTRARGIPLRSFENNNGLKLCTETSTLWTQLKVHNGTT